MPEREGDRHEHHAVGQSGSTGSRVSASGAGSSGMGPAGTMTVQVTEIPAGAGAVGSECAGVGSNTKQVLSEVGPAVKADAQELKFRTEDFVIEHPLKAIGMAAGAGLSSASSGPPAAVAAANGTERGRGARAAAARDTAAGLFRAGSGRRPDAENPAEDRVSRPRVTTEAKRDGAQARTRRTAGERVPKEPRSCDTCSPSRRAGCSRRCRRSPPGAARRPSRRITTVRESDGDTKTTERKVTKQPDGTMRETTTERKVDN